jgi:hypothetical protein
MEEVPSAYVQPQLRWDKIGALMFCVMLSYL